MDGALWIGGCFGCSPVDHHDDIVSDISDLSALIKLKRVTGQLSIVITTSLSSLQGLDSLSFIGGLYMDDVTELTSYDGFDGLDSINGRVTLSTNVVLNNLDSFNELTYIRDELFIETHHSMVAITGFTSLHSIGSLKIWYNPLLTDISGLSNLETIKINFDVAANSKLSNLCSVRNAVVNGPIEGTFFVSGNGYNPTRTEIISGNCSN